jgi:hypothetical protein
MRCLVLILLTVSIGLVCGCDRDKGAPSGGPDLMTQKPTEEEVVKYVRDRSNRGGGGMATSGSPHTVELLSPLMPVPASYFIKQKKDIDPAAVTAYVAIKSAGPKSQTTIQLVVIGRNSRPHEPNKRGQIDEYQIIAQEHVARDLYGPEWLAEHPWPKDSEAKPKARGAR